MGGSMRNQSKVWRGLVASMVAVAALAVGAGLLAQDAAPAARAARLASVDGSVQLSQGAQVIADPALANTPLFEGTQVATSADGRAEIQFDDGSVARLSPDSALILSVLRGQGTGGAGGKSEVVLEGGLGYFELQPGGGAGSMQVRFGDAVVTASGFTVLRIDMDTPPGELAVFSGNVHIARGNALALDVHGGESVALNAVDPARFDLKESIEPDSWDAWNSDRDQQLAAEAADQTGATQGIAGGDSPALNDLDANGNWYNVPDQGYVWSPYAASDAGWDPYGSGNWMWTPGFGYIWVSGYSWGYMPYQCGDWNFYDGFGWGWSPGMNGCSAGWWRNGYYGVNIGHGYHGYRPPERPRQPRGPHPVGPVLTGGGRQSAPYPMIAVNRHSSEGVTGLPARDRATPVVIAGHTVEALRPRAQFGNSAFGVENRTEPGRPVSGFQNTSRPSYPGTMGRPTGSNPGSRPSYTPAPRPSGGFGGSRPSGGGGGSRPSGGGGGGSHPSGGGGGGGGSHSGGGRR
jgi:ferric-dicitrate binding protein FerR (iron transport regulator)